MTTITFEVDIAAADREELAYVAGRFAAMLEAATPVEGIAVGEIRARF